VPRLRLGSGGADLSDDSEEADPDTGILLEGVGDRPVRVLRLHGRRRGGSSRVALEVLGFDRISPNFDEIRPFLGDPKRILCFTL
jgi:hypothetical protein